MNELILMMWLVDVVSVSGGMGLIAGILFVPLIVVHVFSHDADFPFKAPAKWLYAIPITLSITAWLMPSKQTLYAAIALKAGSEIAESRLGTKAINALEGVLDEVIEKQTGKKKEGAK